MLWSHFASAYTVIVIYGHDIIWFYYHFFSYSQLRTKTVNEHGIDHATFEHTQLSSRPSLVPRRFDWLWCCVTRAREDMHAWGEGKRATHLDSRACVTQPVCTSKRQGRGWSRPQGLLATRVLANFQRPSENGSAWGREWHNYIWCIVMHV
jgi:hypothetical protein